MPNRIRSVVPFLVLALLAGQAAIGQDKAKDKDSKDKGKSAAPDSPKIEWTLDLDKMTIPDAPVSGKILGASFRLDDADLLPNGALHFYAGNRVMADLRIVIHLRSPRQPVESFAGKSFKVRSEMKKAILSVLTERNFPRHQQ